MKKIQNKARICGQTRGLYLRFDWQLEVGIEVSEVGSEVTLSYLESCNAFLYQANTTLATLLKLGVKPYDTRYKPLPTTISPYPLQNWREQGAADQQLSGLDNGPAEDRRIPPLRHVIRPEMHAYSHQLL